MKRPFVLVLLLFVSFGILSAKTKSANGSNDQHRNETPTDRNLFVETFESGSINSSIWAMSGNQAWTITNADKHGGIYSARSGTITHNQTSTMSTTVEVSASTNISFWYKVSSESSYDWLRFYIDGVMQGEWSGTVGWSEAIYALSPGTRQLSWSYIKDISVNGGSDCAWIDDITIAGTGGPEPNSVVLGTGTSTTGNNTASPINIGNKSLHGQSVYTKAELNAAGVFGPIMITALGFDVNSVPNQSLPNFVVRMKHTTATNVSSWQTLAGMETVYGPQSYSPTVGWDMLTFSTPFIWNGVDNLVVDTAFSQVGSTNRSGTVRYSTVSNGYRFVRGNGSDYSNQFSGGNTANTRPNVKLNYQLVVTEPEISIAPAALDFGTVELGSVRDISFTISNTGMGNIILSSSLQISGDDAMEFSLIDSNSYPLTIGTTTPASFIVRFSPTIPGIHFANIAIAFEDGYDLPLSGKAMHMVYGAGFEEYEDFSLDLSPWTQYDGDGSTSYGIQDVSFINSGYTGSFIVFNPTATSPAFGASWTAYSGNKYAAAFAATTPDNNDWLISPAIQVGSSAMVSFWARSVVADYGLERFRVLYSTTGNNCSDFTNYLSGSAGSYLEAPVAWTQYEYELPPSCANSTVYIAIQCVSSDAFVFMVDDFRVFSDTELNPVAGINPSPFRFADFFPNYAMHQTFTLSNSGSGTLTVEVGGINLEGDSEFSLVNLPALPLALSAGQSVSFQVRFYPATAGDYSTNLVILDATDTTTTVEISAHTEANLIPQYPYIEGFEQDVAGWVIRDSDADGYNWEIMSNTAEAKFSFSGQKCLISRSWIADSKAANESADENAKLSYSNEKTATIEQSGRMESMPKSGGKGPLTPDNWLISPQVNIGENCFVNWRVAAQDANWPSETYSVLVSTTTPDPDQFVSKFTETMVDGDWQSRSLSLAEYAGQTVYIAFRHHSVTDMYWLKLDAIKILCSNSSINYFPVEEHTFALVLDAITDTYQNIALNVGVSGNGFANGAMIVAEAFYDNPEITLPNHGLSVHLSGSPFSSNFIQIEHGLGFTPQQAYWRIVPASWNLLTIDDPSVSTWNSTTLGFTLPESGKANGDLEIVFPKSAEDTLPVTLTSFVAIPSGNGKVRLAWATATETGVMGYYILRNNSDDISGAITISAMIEAANSSTEQSYEFTDASLSYPDTYYYWLLGRDFDGKEYTFGPVNVNMAGAGDLGDGIPAITKAFGNYPNPFNPSTTIRYGVAEPGMAKITIYNSRGQLLRQFRQDHRSPGFYKLIFDGRDDLGRKLSSGVYFYTFESGEHKSVHRMMLMK